MLMSQVKTHLSSQTRMEPFKGLPQVTSQSQAHTGGFRTICFMEERIYRNQKKPTQVLIKMMYKPDGELVGGGGGVCGGFVCGGRVCGGAVGCGGCTAETYCLTQLANSATRAKTVNSFSPPLHVRVPQETAP